MTGWNRYRHSGASASTSRGFIATLRHLRKSRRVLLEVATPLDYFLLAALSAERVFLHLFLEGRERKAPGVFDLMVRMSGRITGALQIPPIGDELKALQGKTQLVHLTLRAENPFSTNVGLPKTTLRERLIAAFFDAVVLRNYAAHHDVLDDKLIAEGWGKEPLEALLVVTLLVLRATIPGRPEP